MKQCLRVAVAAGLMLAFMPQSASAQDVDMSGLRAKLPSDDRLHQLEAQMQANPQHLDYFFAYAQMATALGEFDKAADAYEHMLQVDPQLDRVKLELGVVYMKQRKYRDSEGLLRDVLARDIPPGVRQNVEKVLAQVEQAGKEHFWTGSASWGVLYDSNGNSASDSDRVTVFDVSLPLAANDQGTGDAQMFAAASVNHRYQQQDELAEGVLFGWGSSLNLYRSEQEHLDNLNLQVVGLRSGPTVTFKDLGLQLGATADYTHIILDGYSYIKLPSLEVNAAYILNESIRLSGAVSQEYREFLDSPNVSTYDDRSGPAHQGKLGLTWGATRQDIFDVISTFRHEDTKRIYYDNDQQRLDLGYTRLWEDDIFTRAQAGYKNAIYNGPDPFISTKTRHDSEYNFGFTLGKQFDKNITWTGGYQYRKVDSNLENYEYDNHRYTTSVNVRF